MSEITKVCETCNDTRKVSSDAWEAPPVPCPDCCEEPEKVCGRCGGSGEQDDGCCVRCGGHGTVVDVQAQLDSARIMCERLESALRGKESENAELRAEVARLEGRVKEAEWILKRQYGAYMSKSKFGTFLDRLNSWLAGCKS